MILFSIVCLVVLVILVKFGGRARVGPPSRYLTEVYRVILRLKMCLPSTNFTICDLCNMMMRAGSFPSVAFDAADTNKGKQNVSRIIERLDVVALLFVRGVRGCYFELSSTVTYFPK